jgi:5'-methylthioadenosine phosphorylase
MMGKIAIIGGTGVYDPNLLENAEEKTVTTPYGTVSFWQGAYRGQEVLFLNRHGKGHSVPPHLINYRANLKALALAGADRVIATAAVVSLNEAYPPGTLMLPDQFLDFTKSRAHTFYEGGPDGVVHCDMTSPYCVNLREVISRAGAEHQIAAANGGVYVCTEGPRFETAAEIKAFKQLGGDVIGMTGVPEVSLSRELGLCYAAIAVVTNFAAGISPSPLTHSEVLDEMKKSISRLQALLMASAAGCEQLLPCGCDALLRRAGTPS